MACRVFSGCRRKPTTFCLVLFRVRKFDDSRLAGHDGGNFCTPLWKFPLDCSWMENCWPQCRADYGCPYSIDFARRILGTTLESGFPRLFAQICLQTGGPTMEYVGSNMVRIRFLRAGPRVGYLCPSGSRVWLASWILLFTGTGSVCRATTCQSRCESSRNVRGVVFHCGLYDPRSVSVVPLPVRFECRHALNSELKGRQSCLNLHH